MQLFIIRHGETEANLSGIIQGHTNIELNERGKTQAKALTKRLALEKIDHIFSSDLSRAVNTVRPVSELLNIPVHFRSELRERHYGILEGRPVSEYHTSIASSGKSWEEYKPDGGENFFELRKRVSSFVDFLKNNHMSDSVLISSHSGTNKILIGQLLSLSNEKTRSLGQSNTNVSLFNLLPDGTVSPEYLNCTAHLT